MTAWNRRQGDVNDTINVALGGIADITGCTVTGRVEAIDAPGTSATLTGSILVPVATATVKCAVTINLGGAAGWLSTAPQGKWRFDQNLVFPSGAKVTWPGIGHDIIIVTAAIVVAP